MPSALKARAGRPSVAEMREDLSKLRKPSARMLEDIFEKYHRMCMAVEPPMKEVEVFEPDVNWRAVVMSLPAPQNKEVLGVGIHKVLVKETECIYEGVYRFHVRRLDGTFAPFDFKDAYDDAYHNYKDTALPHHVETALRAAVLPHLIQYKEMMIKDGTTDLVSNISGVVLPWTQAVVQHFPVPLDSIITSFLNENQLKIQQILLDASEDHGYVIRDPSIAENWRVYHRSHANFRIISTEEAQREAHI
jgi:hypothetical protein